MFRSALITQENTNIGTAPLGILAWAIETSLVFWDSEELSEFFVSCFVINEALLIDHF